MGLIKKASNVKIRPASLEDANKIAELQNRHAKEMKILEMPKSSEKIRLAIGSSFLNKNTYYVVEEENMIVGYIEQVKQNHSQVMISYPYVDLDHPNRHEIQRNLVESTLKKLIKYGYQYVSTQLSHYMTEAENLFDEFGFTERQVIFQTYTGVINPDITIEPTIDFRRVKLADSDIVYNWMKRQLNTLSPIYITKDNFDRFLQAPKHVRDGWSMAIDKESRQPLAMVSSMVDAHTEDVIIFGPFNPVNQDNVRLELFNELLWYHRLKGRETMRLMRIVLFDNDEELITRFGLEKSEEIYIMSKKLY